MVRHGEDHLVSLPNRRPIRNLRIRPSKPLNFDDNPNANDDARSLWSQAEWAASSQVAGCETVNLLHPLCLY